MFSIRFDPGRCRFLHFGIMPAINIVKQFVCGQYYHVYNRDVAKQNIFLDQADKRYFLGLLDRHLNPANTQTDTLGLPYRKFDENLEVLAFCFMNNHFHILIHLEKIESSITELLRSVGIAYTMYFNKKYNRVGGLFQGTYKASQISNDAYLLHVSRYIHLNPRNYLTYKYSSLPSYFQKTRHTWLKPEKILSLFEDSNYLDFVNDYKSYKLSLIEIKHELANK